MEMLVAEEMELQAGWSLANVAAGYGTWTATTEIVTGLGGETVMDMGVGALAACGPIGWAILGVGVLGAAATGYVLAR